MENIENIIKSEYENINGIIVLKNGEIYYEKYFNGHVEDDSYHVTSVTKTIISALVGIALEKGYIKNLNQKVLDFFPEYDFDDLGGYKKEISLYNLLTMTAPYNYPDWKEPFEEMCSAKSWKEYILNIMGYGGQIGNFKYSSAGAHLLSIILSKTTGKSAREFANENLFKALGMREIADYEMESYDIENLFGEKVRGWVKDPDGNSVGGWGLTLTVRDMSKFGQVYLNNGIFKDERIIPEKWVKDSTCVHSQSSMGQTILKYGYMWWLRDGDGFSAYMAMGDGGNLICCIPEKKLVIAIASEFIPNSKDQWDLIKKFILIG